MATTVEEKSVLGLENPMGTDGFEFVEYTAPDTSLLRELFTKMGFPAIATHKRKDVTLHRQGEINFIINAEAGSYAEAYARDHGPSACAMAFRVKDAKAAFERAVRLGATPVKNDVAHGEMDIPAIEGIGGSRLFFVDTYGDKGSIYEVDFDFFSDAPERLEELDSRLTYIDHLTHNVQRGRMKVWADFYEKLFNFREIRYFDIEGKQTGLFSKAMTSPCGKIRIPLNDIQDDKSQIEEFLRD
jgi:4-hydroxyphenylpyruvate dioxygenase